MNTNNAQHDHVDRAAEIIYVEVLGLPDYSPDAVDDHNRHSYRGDCDCNHNDRRAARMTAEALDTAGLLASPAHDAAAAARALREAVEWMDESTPDDGVMVTRLQAFDFFNDYADRIEREGAES